MKLGLGGLVGCICSTFDQVILIRSFWVIECICLKKMQDNFKTAGRTAKKIVWKSGYTCGIRICDSVNFEIFKVTLGHRVPLLGLKEHMCKIFKNVIYCRRQAERLGP